MADWTGSLLHNPQIIEYCNERDTDSLSGLHASLVNQDRIKAFLEKEKLVLFPKGQKLNGLIFQCERKPELKVRYLVHKFITGPKPVPHWSQTNI